MRQRPVIHVTRDNILFTGGLLGVLYETVFVHADRPTLIVLFAAMMGLPTFLGLDERRSSEAKKEDPPVVGKIE